MMSPQVNKFSTGINPSQPSDSIFQGSQQLLPGDDSNAEIVASLETGIMNLHTNLKNLEGKYIDLANFYKQELVAKKNSAKLKVGSASI